MKPSQQEIIDSLKYHAITEQLEYTLYDYSDWKELENEEFHKLRKEYIDITRKLKEFIERL